MTIRAGSRRCARKDSKEGCQCQHQRRTAMLMVVRRREASRRQADYGVAGLGAGIARASVAVPARFSSAQYEFGAR